ncbi:hypothetical protein [Acinetobacter sp.]|uniref:hypothetical protein n=1 Tax=Acinetobacter sp. TaxID=472 RepID=UPI003D07E389
MKIKIIYILFLFFFCFLVSYSIAGDVVVIGHSGLKKLDNIIIKKLFTGRIVEIDGIAITVINAAPGNSVRTRFLAAFLNQDEDKYIAYWTVRKFIGKGRPPRELYSRDDIINFVQSTPGAIGYIDDTDMKPGLNILNKK